MAAAAQILCIANPAKYLQSRSVLRFRSTVRRAARSSYCLRGGLVNSCFLGQASLSTTKPRCDQSEDLHRTRNIGIIAHIDAGKTTTTERMLYYSGFTRRIGDVDDGSTVTDFLPAERARGITIQSAAITFRWPPATETSEASPQSSQVYQAQPLPKSAFSHTINLIDTPGHADFTFEVLRSLRILDGAVCILDGVAGVEAQTEQVWHQASTYRIPRLVYINKLDRDGAAFGRTVKEVGCRLGGWPAVCQIPWFEGGDGRFSGVADVINLQGLYWKEGGDGKIVKMFDLKSLEEKDSRLAQELKRARVALIELLSEYDEVMVEEFLDSGEDHLAVQPLAILDSLRRCLLAEGSKIIPIFAGASFRNMGVQPLLDAVVNLLPSPLESPDPEVRVGQVKGRLRRLLSGDLLVEERAPEPVQGKQKKKKALPVKEHDNPIEKLQGCGLAFKVVNDSKRGVLVYVRVYSGSLDRHCLLYNTNLNVSERAPRLLKMYANDAVEVGSIPAGHIGVVVGLKHARTGDTLISYSGNKGLPPEPLNLLQLRPIDVPPPVFFASVEPHSLSEEKRVQEALAMLLREDPSLQVTVDEDSGQTLLSGMGELHLEIARDRLINDFQAKASMGRIEISYRESPLGHSGPVTKIFDKEIAGRKAKAGCTVIIEPLDFSNTDSATSSSGVLATESHDGNQIVIIAQGLRTAAGSRKGTAEEESSPLPPNLDPATLCTALLNGCLAALGRGPQFSFPMHSTKVTLTFNPAEHSFGTDTTPPALSAAARLATQSALRDLVSSDRGPGTAIMEPVMNVIISVDDASLGSVVHDISSSRGGHIVSLDEGLPVPGMEASPTSSSSATRLGSVGEAAFVADPNKVYAPLDPFVSPSLDESLISIASRRPRTIAARVPLKEMVGYLKHLRSLTGGRGTFVMSVDRFEKMSSQRQKAVLAELRGAFL